MVDVYLVLQDSFLHIYDWINDADRFATSEVVKILVGNKIDMEESRVVQTEDGERLSKEVLHPSDLLFDVKLR